MSLSSAYCASSEGCSCDRARKYLYVVASVVNSCHWGRPLTLPPLVLKVVNLIQLVSICQCKGIGLYFLGRPSAWYSSLLDLVFFSSEGCECDRASMSLQGW